MDDNERALGGLAAYDGGKIAYAVAPGLHDIGPKEVSGPSSILMNVFQHPLTLLKNEKTSIPQKSRNIFFNNQKLEYRGL